MMLDIQMILAQAAPQAAEAAQQATQAPSGRTLLQYIQDGGFLSYVLIAMSVVAVTLMIRMGLVLRRILFLPEPLMRELAILSNNGDVNGLTVASGRSDAFAPRVLYGAIRRASLFPLGMMEIRSSAEEEMSKESERLHRMNDLIAILAAVAPMLGLLGTVIGMIGAFGSIASLQGAARSNELARFMSMALVNTAEGLAIAIPATIVFGLCRRRIEALVDECADALEPIIAVLQRTATGGPLPKLASALPPRSAQAPQGVQAQQVPRIPAST